MPCFVCVYVGLFNAMFCMCICEGYTMPCFTCVYVRVLQSHVLYVYM